MSTSSPIVVVGAGVLGLTTATLLQKSLPEAQVTIIASELPTSPSPSASYASMWAGAHYRPVAGSTPQLVSEKEMAFCTVEVMRRISKESPESGVEFLPGVEYLEQPPEANLLLRSGDVYAGVGDGFRVMEKDDLPEGVEWGCEYEAYCVNVPVYLTWLLKCFRERSGVIIERRLKNIDEAFVAVKDVKTVVDCSGNGFGLDQNMKVIRGQTVLVKQQYHKTTTRQNADGTWAALIPRPGGGTIVGVSKEVNDMEEKARPETRSQLLEASVKYFPDFIDSVDEFEVLQDNVGRRPWREGGIRIDAETIADERRVVHGYGAGGRGYELSWGVAQRLVKLVKAGGTLVSDCSGR